MPNDPASKPNQENRAESAGGDAVARIAGLEAERDALRARLDRLKQREQKRKAVAEQARAAADRTRATMLSEIDRLYAERPELLEPDAAATIARRSREIEDPRLLYLDLLKNCLTRFNIGERGAFVPGTGQTEPFNPQLRLTGSDWPSDAETMAGLIRLDNVQYCVTDVLERNIPGDLVETGVWRGGTTILMRATLRVYGDTARTVWAADSFAGLPAPDAERYEADRDIDYSTEAGFHYLAVPLEDVKSNFARYGLLDDQVRFLVGWFRDTLPTAPIEQIAVLRLDGDLYESTTDALTALYPKLSAGGYLIVDDYLAWEPCRRAVDDYRASHDITEPIRPIDHTGVYWQRER